MICRYKLDSWESVTYQLLTAFSGQLSLLRSSVADDIHTAAVAVNKNVEDAVALVWTYRAQQQGMMLNIAKPPLSAMW